MVEGTGLENRQRGNSFASSNLALSAKCQFLSVPFCILLSVEFLKFQCIMVLVSLNKSSKNCLDSVVTKNMLY